MSDLLVSMFSSSLIKHLLTNVLSGAIIILLLCCDSKTVPPEPVDCTPYKPPSDAWVYPVQPGSQEWIDLPGTKERFDTCQIPAEKLQIMSSEALVDAWLNFPFNGDIFSTNNMMRSMNYYVKLFSALDELSRRSDRLSTLMRVYSNRNPLCINELDDTKKGEYSFDYGFLEVLLSTDAMLNQSSLDEKKDLVRQAIKKYEGKRNAGNEAYGGPIKSFSLLVCMKALYHANYEPFLVELKNSKQIKLIEFFETGLLDASSEPDEPVVQTILRHSKKFSA